MSRIYFHSKSETTEVGGSERAWFGYLCHEFFCACLDLDRLNPEDDPLWGMLATGERYRAETHYARQGDILRNVEMLKMVLRGLTTDVHIDVDGHPVDTGEAALNTAIQLGGMEMGLAARLHGSCESHLWVDGPNRAWLADIIDRGRRIGIYRAESGWEETAGMLRRRDDEIVATSYSVTNGFPDEYFIRNAGVDLPKPTPEQWEKYEEDARSEAFYEMSDDDRWSYGERALRKSWVGLELRPDNWHDVHYDHTGQGERIYTAFDIREAANSHGLAKMGVDNSTRP